MPGKNHSPNTDRVVPDPEQSIAAIEAENKCYADLCRIVPDAFLEIDVQGRISDCRFPKAETRFFSDHDIVGRNLSEILPPDALAIYQKCVSEADRTGESRYNTYRLELDGENYWYELFVLRKIDSGKKSYSVLVRDISRFIRLQQVLAQGKDEWEQTFDLAPDAISILDMEFRIKRLNKSMAQLIGKTPSEAIGFPCYNLVHRMETAPEKCPFRKLQSDNSPHVSDIYIPHLDKWVNVTVSPLTDSNGNLTGCIHIARDNTKQKRMEQALRKSEAMFRTIFESSPLIIFLKDRSLKYIKVNSVMGKLFNCEAETLIGLTDKDLFTEREAEKITETDISVLHGNSSDISYPLTIHGETRYFHTVKVPLRIEGDEIVGIVGFAMDITRERLAEIEAKEIQAQLFQSQKLEAIGTLVSGIAHDFNNILTIIQGSAQMLLLDTDESMPIYTDVRQINMACGRAARLTRQLLIYARKNPTEFVNINLNETITGLMKMLKRLIGENISLETELEESLWVVSADEGNIEQAVMNLCINARDAMPDGGKIIIRTQNRVIDSEYVKRYPAAKTGKFVSITVEDTGIGIPEDLFDHIFDPFFTTKESGKGTGLGLSVVYGIAKNHNGWIWVDSEPGQGARFDILLPAVLSGQIDSDAEEEEFVDIQGNSERVLVVEDEEGIARLLKRILTQYNYECMIALTVEEARRIFQEENGRFDLLLSDVVLPDGNGVELAESFTASNPDLSVLLSSGYADAQSLMSRIKQREIPFIQKPYSNKILLRTIKYILSE